MGLDGERPEDKTQMVQNQISGGQSTKNQCNDLHQEIQTEHIEPLRLKGEETAFTNTVKYRDVLSKPKLN